jgi:hypothetical protein
MHFGENGLLVAHELECVYAHRPIDAGITKARLRSVCDDKSRPLRKAKPPRDCGATSRANVGRIDANHRGASCARDEEAWSTLAAPDVGETKPRSQT